MMFGVSGTQGFYPSSCDFLCQLFVASPPTRRQTGKWPSPSICPFGEVKRQEQQRRLECQRAPGPMVGTDAASWRRGPVVGLSGTGQRRHSEADRTACLRVHVYGGWVDLLP
ncbi:unnamed protein product [Prorocentrum cordatum]|uniref:Uncharacterized protein n=1 Tax=Prorocentrum cordatum TaxID=2364126 RepID=A0ABN9TE24_9DINO|nr:unnamed protein product [Polarella glacialis]